MIDANLISLQKNKVTIFKQIFSLYLDDGKELNEISYEELFQIIQLLQQYQLLSLAEAPSTLLFQKYTNSSFESNITEREQTKYKGYQTQHQTYLKRWANLVEKGFSSPDKTSRIISFNLLNQTIRLSSYTFLQEHFSAWSSKLIEILHLQNKTKNKQTNQLQLTLSDEEIILLIENIKSLIERIHSLPNLRSTFYHSHLPNLPSILYHFLSAKDEDGENIVSYPIRVSAMELIIHILTYSPSVLRNQLSRLQSLFFPLCFSSMEKIRKLAAEGLSLLPNTSKPISTSSSSSSSDNHSSQSQSGSNQDYLYSLPNVISNLIEALDRILDQLFLSLDKLQGTGGSISDLIHTKKSSSASIKSLSSPSLSDKNLFLEVGRIEEEGKKGMISLLNAFRSLSYCIERCLSQHYVNPITEIPIHSILQLITRTISMDPLYVSSLIGKQNLVEDSHVTNLFLHLPSLHQPSFQLLRVLIDRAHSTLLIHTSSICQLIQKAYHYYNLETTGMNGELRVDLYLLILHSILHFGVSSLKHLCLPLLPNIIKDLESMPISISKTEISVHISSSHKKKRKRSTNNIVLSSDASSITTLEESFPSNPQSHFSLFHSILSTIEVMIERVGNHLSTTWRESLDRALLNLAFPLQYAYTMSPMSAVHNPSCRLALFRSLFSSALHPLPSLPSILPYLVKIFNHALVNESSHDIILFCNSALSQITLLLHPLRSPSYSFSSTESSPLQNNSSNSPAQSVNKSSSSNIIPPSPSSPFPFPSRSNFSSSSLIPSPSSDHLQNVPTKLLANNNNNKDEENIITGTEKAHSPPPPSPTPSLSSPSVYPSPFQTPMKEGIDSLSSPSPFSQSSVPTPFPSPLSPLPQTPLKHLPSSLPSPLTPLSSSSSLPSYQSNNKNNIEDENNIELPDIVMEDPDLSDDGNSTDSDLL